MKFARERAHDLWTEIAPLLQAHYEEIAADKDIPLSPNVAVYSGMEDAGILRCFTVREDAKLIGYAVFMVQPNPHYSGSLQAVEDVLFVHPDYRNSRAGLTLIRFAEDELRREGVQKVFHHVKVKHPQLGKILERMGYEVIELNYAKRLDVER